MLSYQHAYHAGNFADVIKHVVLSTVLTYLIKKEKPLFYLETHAGRGLYDIRDKHATKTGEANLGIDKLWSVREQLPPVFLPYIEAIQACNQPDMLRFYPGSPALAVKLLRPIDRLFLCELHPQEFECLRSLPREGQRVFSSHSDGINELTALLPPPERRGLVFIDPAYELKSEYKSIPEAIKKAYRHFSHGVFCLWYPLIDNKLQDQLQRGLSSIDAANQLQLEFYLTNKPHPGLRGCGLWIVNPPFPLKTELAIACETFKRIFNPGESDYKLT